MELTSGRREMTQIVRDLEKNKEIVLHSGGAENWLFLGQV